LKDVFGCFLLGAAAAGAAALGTSANLRHVADDVESLFVRLALGASYAIPWKRETTRLQILLETRLCILERRRSRKRGHPRLEQPFDHFLRSLQAPVEKHRAAHGFECVGKDRLAAESARLQLSGTELEHFTQPDLRRHLREGLGADDPCTQTAQVTLGAIRKGKKQVPGNDQVENRIAEEFEALVVRAGRAAVSQGRNEKLWITRVVAQLVAYPTDGPVPVLHIQADGLVGANI
jgi:hypothetical protein